MTSRRKTEQPPLPVCLTMARMRAQASRDIEAEITHSFRCEVCREAMTRAIEQRNPKAGKQLRDLQAHPEKFISFPKE